jgi:organic hydroperoxide reductase OsmC/OhrA
MGADHVLNNVTLRPRIVFAPNPAPGAATIAEMHDEAHRDCFIANSVKTEIKIE